MKNIIDIYESILSTTKDKVKNTKRVVNGLTLKHLDDSKYKKLFDLSILEDVIFHLMNWKAFDKDIIYKVIRDMNVHDIPLDDDVIDFYYRLINIHRVHKVCDQWMYYYRDVYSAATEVCDIVLKPVFKEGKIYKGYSKTQLKMRERSVSFWDTVDTASQYVVFYDKHHHYANWFIVPKSVSGEDKIFMESLMNLMVKYNK